MRNDPFGLTSRPPVIGRIVTATIALVCVLIVYDGWAALKLFDVVLIVVGPVIAIFTSHLFSSSLVQEVELGRRPTMQEWLATARFESRFLLLAVPPLGILLVLRIANVTLTDSVQVVIWLEALSLSFWAGLAAWYAGLRGRSLALSILGGLVVSAIILLLQVFLQPGKALNDGVAAPVEPSSAVVLPIRESTAVGGGWLPLARSSCDKIGAGVTFANTGQRLHQSEAPCVNYFESPPAKQEAS